MAQDLIVEEGHPRTAQERQILPDEDGNQSRQQKQVGDAVTDEIPRFDFAPRFDLRGEEAKDLAEDITKSHHDAKQSQGRNQATRGTLGSRDQSDHDFVCPGIVPFQDLLQYVETLLFISGQLVVEHQLLGLL